MAEDKSDALPLHDKNAPSSSASVAKPVTIDDDSDPDFDDLDGMYACHAPCHPVHSRRYGRLDVLDQFSSAHEQSKSQTNVQPEQPTPSTSGPGRPSSSDKTPTAAPPSLASQPTESEEAFMARLASEMSSALGNLNPDPSASSASTEDISKMGNELDEFTSAMEKQGVNPEDLLKAILGDSLGTGAQPAPSEPKSQPSKQPPPPRPSSSSAGEKESFDSTIRRTMERIQASDSHATSAATKPATADTEEDILATLLKAMESSGPDTTTTTTTTTTATNVPNSEDSLSKMFLNMMEQLTNKDMLYEPMKELDSKYPAWLANNKPKLPEEEYKRYEGQRGVVMEIVAKFEEKGYSDEEAGCREFIWERMQKMQGLGSPPEDLIANPLPGMVGGIGGREGEGEGGEGGCPTQ